MAIFNWTFSQDKNQTIDLGSINLRSTEQSKHIDDLYQQAEEKILRLEREIAILKGEKKGDKIFETQLQKKLDSVNRLTSIQSALLVEKNKIIGNQEVIIARKEGIIKYKDIIIARKDSLLSNYQDSMQKKNKIIDSLENIISGITVFDKPKKKQIITLYGKNYKANETILTIEFDDKNRPIINSIDSIKLSIIYAQAKEEDRKVVLTSRKNMESKNLIPSQIPGGEPWSDKSTFVDLIEILRARFAINFGMQGNYLKNNPIKDDFGKRVFISLSK